MNEIDKKIRKNKLLIIAIFSIVVVAIILISYNFVLGKIRHTFETVNFNIYGNEEPAQIQEGSDEEQQALNKIAESELDDNKQSVKGKKINNSKPSYIAYLEIPVINLKQGLMPKESKYNNVNQNIQIIRPSDYPDVENGNLILASHSGTSAISYFKNLYKVQKNDQVFVIYNNIKYKYNIVNIYTVPKNGKAEIYRNSDKTVITLITCTKDSDTEQTIYIGELISKEGV